MKKSIHNTELRFWDRRWRFALVEDPATRALGVQIAQTPGGCKHGARSITIPRHHLPAVVSFLRWGLLELQEIHRRRNETRSRSL